MSFTFSALVGTLVTLFGLGNAPTIEKNRPDFTCGEIEWTSGPEVSSGEFDGTVQVACEFVSNAGGGFPALSEQLNQSTLGADEVHEGPIPTTVEGIGGNRYDVTEQISTDLTVRGDRAIATDDTSILYDLFESSKVWGEGDLAYLTKIESNLIVSKVSRNKYRVIIEYRSVVDKPWFAPVGIFLNQVADSMEAEVEASKEPTVSDLSQYL